MVYSEKITLKTKGFCDIINITERVSHILKESPIERGIINVFCTGSTCGITIIEYEEGVLKDLQRAMEEIAPADRSYEHNRLLGDGNGFSHVRSAILKPSISVPVLDGTLALGTWQEIVFIDFDNRHRDREIIIQIVGE